MSTAQNYATQLSYEVTGSGDPILFISGANDDRTGWALNLPAFADFRCITFDNRDVGASPRADSAYTVADMAQDTLGLLDRIGPGPVHIVGHSLGSAIAQELCLAAPERVRSLVLVGSWARNDTYTSGLLTMWKLLADRLTDEREFIGSLLFDFVGNSMVETHGADELVAAFTERPPQPRDAFKRQIDAALGHDTLDRLGRINRPVLVVWGDEERVFPARHFRQLVDGIPGAEGAIVPGTGHSPLVEDPDAFNTAVRAFLTQH